MPKRKTAAGEDIYQELLDKAEPLIDELVEVLGNYQQGVAMIGLSTVVAAHARMHAYDADTWLTLLLRAGMPNWTAEETIAAVDDISDRLHEGYERLFGEPTYMN